MRADELVRWMDAQPFDRGAGTGELMWWDDRREGHRTRYIMVLGTYLLVFSLDEPILDEGRAYRVDDLRFGYGIAGSSRIIFPDRREHGG